MNATVHGPRGVKTLVEYVDRENREVGDIIEKRDETDRVVRREQVTAIERDPYVRNEDGVFYGTTRQTLVDLDTGAIRTVEYKTCFDGVSSPETAIVELEALGQKLRKPQEALYHFSLHWQTGEQPTDAEMFSAAQYACQRLGFGAEAPRVYAIHRDTNNIHVHAAIFRGKEREPGKWVLHDPFKVDRRGDFYILNGADGVCRTLEARHNELHPERPWAISAGIGERQPSLNRESHQLRFSGWLRDGGFREALESAINGPLPTWEQIHRIARDDFNVRIERRGAGLMYVDRDYPKTWHVKASALPESLQLRHLETTLGKFEAHGEMRNTFASSGSKDFHEYICGADFAAQRRRDALKDAIKTRGGEKLQRAAALYGIAIVRDGGGYVLRDITAIDDDSRRVKITEALGNAARQLHAKLDTQIPPPQIEEDRDTLELRGYAAYLEESRERYRFQRGEYFAANAYDLVQEIFDKNATLTTADINRFIRDNSVTPEQRERIAGGLQRLVESGVIVALRDSDDSGAARERWTTLDEIEVEHRMTVALDALLNARDRDAIPAAGKELVAVDLKPGQRAFVDALLSGSRFVVLEGHAGTGKTFAVGVAREIMERDGYRFIGIAELGKAAEELGHAAKIDSSTIASFLRQYESGRLTLDERTIVVMDEANMAQVRSHAAVMEAVLRSGATLAVAGDRSQLHAVGPGDTFHFMAERAKDRLTHMSDVVRQNEQWRIDACDAARDPSTVMASLRAHRDRELVHEVATADAAIAKCVEVWDRLGVPVEQRGLFTDRNADKERLDAAIRDLRLRRGDVDERGVTIETAKWGDLEIARGDRVYFTRNERDVLDVKNGTIGTVLAVDSVKKILSVKIDGSERIVTVDPAQYRDIGYAYALNTYKSEGITVQRSVGLETRATSQEALYVRLTRAREDHHIVYASAEFHFQRSGPQDYLRNVAFLASRQRSKDFAMQYERAPETGDLRGALRRHDDGVAHAVFNVGDEQVVRQSRSALRQERSETEERLRSAHERYLQQRVEAKKMVAEQVDDRHAQRDERARVYDAIRSQYKATIERVKQSPLARAVMRAHDTAAETSPDQARALAGASVDTSPRRGTQIVRDASGQTLFAARRDGEMRARDTRGLDAMIAGAVEGGGRLDGRVRDRAAEIQRNVQRTISAWSDSASGGPTVQKDVTPKSIAVTPQPAPQLQQQINQPQRTTDKDIKRGRSR